MLFSIRFELTIKLTVFEHKTKLSHDPKAFDS
jgi:hypothetical protein